MADGTYERRGPREAELKRFQRILAARRAQAAAESSSEPVVKPTLPVDAFVSNASKKDNQS